VLDGEYGVQIIVVLDDHAGTELGGRDRHRLKKSPYTIALCGAGGRRAGHNFHRHEGVNVYFTHRCTGKETFRQSRSSQCNHIVRWVDAATL
jgi:hypothetical protein